MQKIFITIILLIIFIPRTFAQTFNLGRFSIAESRIQLGLNDFQIKHLDTDANSPVAALWIPSSVQWIRNDNNLLAPRAILKVIVKAQKNTVSINYQNKTILLSKNAGFLKTQIYIDLFTPETIYVYEGAKLIDKIVILPKPSKISKSKQLIDYSCSPYGLKIEGIDNEYLSVGCKMSRLGNMGHETPRLELTISATNLKLDNNAQPPYTLFLDDNSPVEINLKKSNENEADKTLRIQAQLPARLYRLKTSLGFGPYIYQAQEDTNIQKDSIAPSLMIYAKYDLTETASIKAFDALLYSKSFFNNSGLYFSYDLAQALDERVLVNALIGFQGLHYRYTTGSPTVFRVIYPQGFEILYKHAFIENYNLAYGMFLSTNSEKYTNAWFRYGKKNFLELNYITWGHEKSQIKMWGLSVGIPFFNAL